MSLCPEEKEGNKASLYDGREAELAKSHICENVNALRTRSLAA
jgi:hypothetical protein